MNSENQFETIILKILESDPQLLVAASMVLVILIVIGVFFVKTLKKLFSDETQTPPLSEKDRLKKLEELAKEEEELREQRDKAKLEKISDKEDSAKLELQQQEAQLRFLLLEFQLGAVLFITDFLKFGFIPLFTKFFLFFREFLEFFQSVFFTEWRSLGFVAEKFFEGFDKKHSDHDQDHQDHGSRNQQLRIAFQDLEDYGFKLIFRIHGND